MRPNMRLLIGLAGVFSMALACARAEAATPIAHCQAPAIVTPGSYVVTANLTNPNNAAPCITVKALLVTINLGGYVLIGKGAQVGILGSNFLTVTNGAIEAFATGISATGSNAVLSNVRIIRSTGDGANLGNNARVTGSDFILNGSPRGGGNGLGLGSNAVVSNCVFANNGVFGMGAEDGATVTGSTSSSNGSHGFGMALATMIANTASDNGGSGFVAGPGSVFKGNAATGNTTGAYDVTQSVLIGNSAYGNPGVGFSDGKWSTFQDNTANFNGSAGFVTNGQSTFIGNTSSNNAAGFNVACPTNLVGNTSQSNTNNFLHSGVGCNISNNVGF